MLIDFTLIYDFECHCVCPINEPFSYLLHLKSNNDSSVLSHVENVSFIAALVLL
jgi:hypothetical protein